MYKSLFIDLDDTIWAFSENARDTFEQMYERFGYDRFFSSFLHFYTIYKKRNTQLWVDYADGKITKDELNRERFSYPLRMVGVTDAELPEIFAASFFKEIAFKKKLMPGALKALEYLHSKYNLYILSNGFHGLQQQKIELSDVDKYFNRIILSEDVGVHKPYKELFDYALSVTGAEAETSLMIGDSWENDIVGARNAGWGQGFYNVSRKANLPFEPTFVFSDWNKIQLYV